MGAISNSKGGNELSHQVGAAHRRKEHLNKGTFIESSYQSLLVIKLNFILFLAVSSLNLIKTSSLTMHQLIKHINFLNYASIHQPYKLQSSMN
jgi:hypothetical protein